MENNQLISRLVGYVNESGHSSIVDTLLKLRQNHEAEAVMSLLLKSGADPDKLRKLVRKVKQVGNSLNCLRQIEYDSRVPLLEITQGSVQKWIAGLPNDTANEPRSVLYAFVLSRLSGTKRIPAASSLVRYMYRTTNVEGQVHLETILTELIQDGEWLLSFCRAIPPEPKKSRKGIPRNFLL